jgi:hypothetical protein
LLKLIWCIVTGLFRSRAALEAENVMLRKGGRRFCGTTPMGLPQWIFLSSRQFPFGCFMAWILNHRRRQILWLGVTAHPTSQWVARQLTEAFGWTKTPATSSAIATGSMVKFSPTSGHGHSGPAHCAPPWQNGHAERLIGSLRRECLDHAVVFGERHLRQLLLAYIAYNFVRTHLSLNKDAPVPRAIQTVVHIHARPMLGGLHHRYSRI